jgi:hypothetical protein
MTARVRCLALVFALARAFLGSVARDATLAITETSCDCASYPDFWIPST